MAGLLRQLAVPTAAACRIAASAHTARLLPATSTPLLGSIASSLAANGHYEPRRHYAMRLELTEYGIIWRRPEYVPSWKPEKSGDLAPMELLEKSKPILKVQPAQELLKEADEATQRLLSIEFNSNKEQMKLIRQQKMSEIQRHQFDVGTHEVQIAMLTVRIRNMQRILLKVKGRVRNTKAKIVLQETIDRRKVLLKHLRRMDYKRFEWLIENLNILYRPPPKYFKWVTRKLSLRKLVRMKVKEIENAKLDAYKAELEAQKPLFLKEKEDTIKWIEEQEQSLSTPIKG